MSCPICRAENRRGAKTCSACGSNLATRGGADIILHDDGKVDHAGDSRWKVGAGTAGAGTLFALAKLKALPFLLLKLYWMFTLVRLTTLGGIASFIGIVAIVALVGGTLFRFRRRLPILR